MDTVILTKDYIKMLIALLRTDGNNSKDIVAEKLENLIGGNK